MTLRRQANTDVIEDLARRAAAPVELVKDLYDDSATVCHSPQLPALTTCAPVQRPWGNELPRPADPSARALVGRSTRALWCAGLGSQVSDFSTFGQTAVAAKCLKVHRRAGEIPANLPQPIGHRVRIDRACGAPLRHRMTWSAQPRYKCRTPWRCRLTPTLLTVRNYPRRFTSSRVLDGHFTPR
jgi:hypothetical protein